MRLKLVARFLNTLVKFAEDYEVVIVTCVIASGYTSQF